MTDLAAPRRGAFSRGRDRRTERLPGMTPCQSLPTTLSAGALPPSSRAGSCGGGDGSGIRPFGSMDPRCGGGRSAREKALLIASCWRRIFRIPSAFCSVPMHTSGGPQGRRRAGTINDPGGPVGGQIRARRAITREFGSACDLLDVSGDGVLTLNEALRPLRRLSPRPALRRPFPAAAPGTTGRTGRAGTGASGPYRHRRRR